jgi:cysteine synthase A
VGTGGTITGLGRYFKEIKKAATRTVGVEPRSLPAIQKKLDGQALEPAGHLIQGIGAGFVPKNLDLGLLDEVQSATDKQAIQLARRLAREEGLLCGISSGAAVAVALRLAALPKNKGLKIVAILPDGGDRYVSTELYGNLFEDKAAAQSPL